MYLQSVCLILCSITVQTVTSINIEGPPLTIYRPCGLSLLHFNTIDDKTWQGVLDFGSYRNSDKADIVINFKEENTFFLTASSDKVTVQITNNRTIIIHAELPVIKPVTFDVILIHSVLKVPFIADLILNGETICNNQNESPVNMSARSFKQQLQEVCGKKSPDHEELISLRTEAKAGDWPWAVAVFHSDSKTYVGGGSILSHSAVITSAYVIFDKTASTITVIAGTTDLADASQTGRQTVQATELIIHPGFRSDRYNIDNIGIIRVKQFTFSDYVKPLCIGELLYGKTSAVVAGFGNLLSDRGPGYKLRSIDTEIQTERECKKFYSEFTEFNLCAGYGPTSNLSPTRGDGGIGLVVSTTGYDQKTTWLLRGILVGCVVKNEECDTSIYSVYINIATYLGWINIILYNN